MSAEPDDDGPIAIALRYARGEGAPAVTASGQGAVAERIVERAIAHRVPVHANADLAKLLAKVPVGKAKSAKVRHLCRN